MDSLPFPLDAAEDDVSSASGPLDTAQAEPRERRSSPRRQMPFGPAFVAEFVVLGRLISLSMDDVSLGGVALRATRAEASGLLVGRKLPQVRLTMGDHGSITVGLEVRSRRNFRSFLAGEQVQVGCSFVGMDVATQTRLLALIDKLKGPGAGA